MQIEKWAVLDAGACRPRRAIRRASAGEYRYLVQVVETWSDAISLARCRRVEAEQNLEDLAVWPICTRT